MVEFVEYREPIEYLCDAHVNSPWYSDMQLLLGEQPAGGCVHPLQSDTHARK